MTSIILLVLVGAWVGYIFLWWKDGRAISASRGDGIRSFSRSLGSLGGSSSRPSGSAAPFGAPSVGTPSLGAPSLGIPPAPRPGDLVSRPITAADAARRRQEVVGVLAIAAVLTLIAVPLLGMKALVLHLLVDAALGWFGYAVVRRQHLAAEREIKVRMLYPDAEVDDRVLVSMERTASG